MCLLLTPVTSSSAGNGSRGKNKRPIVVNIPPNHMSHSSSPLPAHLRTITRHKYKTTIESDPTIVIQGSFYAPLPPPPEPPVPTAPNEVVPTRTEEKREIEKLAAGQKKLGEELSAVKGELQAAKRAKELKDERKAGKREGFAEAEARMKRESERYKNDERKSLKWEKPKPAINNDIENTFKEKERLQQQHAEHRRNYKYQPEQSTEKWHWQQIPSPSYFRDEDRRERSRREAREQAHRREQERVDERERSAASMTPYPGNGNGSWNLNGWQTQPVPPPTANFIPFVSAYQQNPSPTRGNNNLRNMMHDNEARRGNGRWSRIAANRNYEQRPLCDPAITILVMGSLDQIEDKVDSVEERLSAQCRRSRD